MFSINDIDRIVKGNWICRSGTDRPVSMLLTDSRRTVYPIGETLFFAIPGIHHDGHDFIPQLYKEGVRMFVVSKDIASPGPDADVFHTENTIEALQAIAAIHRRQFKNPVLAITGSNGKTIVKEWLNILLSPHKKVIKSPGSYNSQIGVPLSVWQLRENHQLAIFEAGISKNGEMEKLEKIISPDIGIFTNIGSAHDEGFTDRDQKIREKMKLFANSRRLIYRRDYEDIHRHVNAPSFTWGHHPDSDIVIESEERINGELKINLRYENHPASVSLPFVDSASVENAMHALAFMVQDGFTWTEISEGLTHLRPMRMRLELKRGNGGCYVIDDTYNNDLGGLKIALDFLVSQPGANKKTLIISDILQSGLKSEEWISRVQSMTKAAGVSRIIGIGSEWSKSDLPGIVAYEDTESFVHDFENLHFEKEFILVKGARPFRLERIVRLLEEKVHGTVLEVDLNALTHNLNFYRSRLQKHVKVMVMVKAFAYGSGSVEIASLLEFHRVDYLGVAYADEGVYLRNNGIQLPIMVMNPSSDGFETMLKHGLEPEIYNFRLLDDLILLANGRDVNIHLKIDTGMHRLGFENDDLDELIKRLSRHPNIRICTVFSHLAGADEAEHEAFSRMQAEQFEQITSHLFAALQINPDRHLLNSPGIIRFPEFQYEMVRLGIGLYGVEATGDQQEKLVPISRLLAVISQIKNIRKGETIGYSRKGKAHENMRIATIAIGYADGFSRAFSNGKGRVWINGSFAPVIGNVCMDMMMVDITGIEAQEGDVAEIFGPNISILEMAQSIGTIPYEILTNVSQRVRRIFYSE